jgi:hypothetical protein
VAFGLEPDFEREDVKVAIAALLDDKVPRVELMTIIAIGWQKFPGRLERLTHCDDATVAEWARARLGSPQE